MKRYLLLTILLLQTTAQATVYRSVDEEGNVVFTDQKKPGSEKIKVEPPTVVKPLSKPSQPATSSPVVDTAAKPAKFPGYTSIKIVQPPNDTVVRDNAGAIAVQFESEPPYSKESGHVVIVELDGKEYGQRFQSSTFALENIDRGTHVLRISLSDEKTNKLLISSDKVTIHLKRFSRVNP